MDQYSPAASLVNDSVPLTKLFQLERNPTQPTGEEGATVYSLPWHTLNHPQRLAVIRRIAEARGRDPRIANKAMQIIRDAGVQPRDFVGQASALLAWVQQNIYYVNEPGERLQDPLYTLAIGYSDCDDSVLLLCALFESIALSWKLVLSGRGVPSDEKMRFIEGQVIQPNVRWAHIYCAVGVPSGRPTDWYFCETTVRGVPLGWDVIEGDHSYLPEMMTAARKPVRQVPAPRAPRGYRPPKMKATHPVIREVFGDAFGEVYGNGSSSPMIGGAVGASLAQSEADEGGRWIEWPKIGQAVMTGVIVSVGTSVLLDWVNGKGIWEGQGHVFRRWGTTK